MNLPDNSESSSTLNRRSFLHRAGIGAAAALLPGAGLALSTGNAQASGFGSRFLDKEILNYALNLEYLEAQYYLYATTGAGLDASDLTGYGPQGTVVIKSNPMVTFTSSVIQGYAEEIAQDELNHVLFLRSALGSSAVAMPQIDLLNSFHTLATAANTLYGSNVIPTPFDPFASDLNFLLGSFIFEDVGVTAYHGAAPFVQNREYLSAAAGILGVEAYHASELRTVLYSMAQTTPSIINIVQAISNLRAALSGAADDQGIVLDGKPNIVPTDDNSLVFSRKPSQVLNVVYGNTSATPGLFFPNGVNELKPNLLKDLERPF